MSEIFAREKLRQRALDELSKAREPMTSVGLAIALRVPTWALEPVLADCRLAGELTFTDGAGWCLPKTKQAAARTDGAQAAIDLGA